MSEDRNFQLRKEFLKKHIGKSFSSGLLDGSYDPSKDPSGKDVVYCPLPEYGIYLLHYLGDKAQTVDNLV